MCLHIIWWLLPIKIRTKNVMRWLVYRQISLLKYSSRLGLSLLNIADSRFLDSLGIPNSNYTYFLYILLIFFIFNIFCTVCLEYVRSCEYLESAYIVWELCNLKRRVKVTKSTGCIGCQLSKRVNDLSENKKLKQVF